MASIEKILKIPTRFKLNTKGNLWNSVLHFRKAMGISSSIKSRDENIFYGSSKLNE